MPEKHLPNFVLAGPAKSGTTALYLMMRQHPQIFFPGTKEPRFFAYSDAPPRYAGPGDEKRFNKTTIHRLEDYLELYKDIGDAIAIGDASPIYMHVPKAVYTMKKYIPNAKIIIMLRNPVERAFSVYLQHLRDGDEKLSFEEAIQQEEKRIIQNWGLGWRYLSLGYIADQIERYLEAFGETQVFFVLYDNFRRDNIETLKELFTFLGVDSNYSPSIVKANVGGIVKNQWLYSLLSSTRRLRVLRPMIPVKYRRIANLWRLNMQSNLVDKPKLPREQIVTLTKLYEKDIRKTEVVTGLDLSEWLRPILENDGQQKNYGLT
jgi:hypothetical protein